MEVVAVAMPATSEDERQVKKVAVLDDYQNVALRCADWSVLDGRAEVVVFADHVSSEAELIHRLQAFEIIVAMRERTPFPRRVLQSLPSLELLVTTGPFNAAIDLEAARAQDVVVSGTGGCVPPTMELTWALIMACVKHTHSSDVMVRGGSWQTALGGDLAGSRIGIIGLGRYGSRVARIAKAFEMEVCAWSQNLDRGRCAELGVEPVSKWQLLESSDVVTIHLVYSERTRALIGSAELRAMKRSSYLINTSRGPIIDEQALIAALQEGWIAGAGLDVFDVEPLPEGHPLLDLSNVVLSPHMGYVTENTYRIFYGDVVDDIAHFLDGSIVREVAPSPRLGPTR
jgi:phosphoglycerate dehydrogenase-like enzyme